MKTESNSMVGTAVGAVGGLGGDGALCAAPKKGGHAAQPVLLVVLAQPAIPWPLWLRRRATSGSARTAESGAALPAGGLAARQRDQGFSWTQWWVMTPLTVMGAFWVTSVLSGLPMVLLVLWAQLTN